MTIKRTINGTEYEFELTTQELNSAFLELQKHYDLLDLKQMWWTGHEEDDPFPVTGEYEDVALKLYRKYLNNKEWWFEDAEDAVNEALRIKEEETKNEISNKN